MTFVDKYVKEILQLEVRLFHAKARLEASYDTEALHDLRIAIRRIRSLLVPVRDVHVLDDLREAAAQVGRLTTPARDREVMTDELESRGLPVAAGRRRDALKADYAEILGHPNMANLFACLDQWPSMFRSTEPGNDEAALARLVVKALTKHVDKLHRALNDEAFDLHELRILVKRTRYLTEAFPELSPLSIKAAKSLKVVQSALGSWHDHHQWCLRAQTEPDLKELEPVWARASVGELEQAAQELQHLKQLLPKITTKSKKPKLKVAARQARYRTPRSDLII